MKKYCRRHIAFSCGFDVINSAADMNNDLKTIVDQADQWKMSFSPDPYKLAQKVIFSRKSRKIYKTSLFTLAEYLTGINKDITVTGLLRKL